MRATVIAVALATAALAGCKKKEQPPPCDTTACCEVYKNEVFQRCTPEQDEVYSCGRQAMDAYEACMDQMR